MIEKRKPPEPAAPEPEVQTGHGRSKVRDDKLKRIIKQHPQRDTPRIDDTEEPEQPPS